MAFQFGFLPWRGVSVTISRTSCGVQNVLGLLDGIGLLGNSSMKFMALHEAE